MGDHVDPLLEALKVTPDNLPLKRHVAGLLLKEGRYGEAAGHYREIVRMDGNASDRLALARACYHLEDYLEAGSHLTKIQEESPENGTSGEISYWLARVNERLGQIQKARSHYEKAVRLDPALADPAFEAALNPPEPQIPVAAHEPEPIAVSYGASDPPQDDFAAFMEKPGVTFEDVGGLDELKENIRMQIIYPFQNPELFIAYGKKIGGGILLYGPPGCGKTHIARATAGECNAHFISIAINEILDMYIGNSEKNLHEIFEMARRRNPTVIFIDELDAIAATRSHGDSRHDRSLTNQLLSELDGIAANNDGLLVLGATNTPWFIDPAMKRPGRFDRMLFVPPPDESARREILKICLKGKPVENIDYDRIAKATPKYSGADLRALCDLAAEEALQDAMKSGQPKPIRTDNLMRAVKKVKPTTLDWLSTAKNYATYSNQGGHYDDIVDYVKQNRI